MQFAVLCLSLTPWCTDIQLHWPSSALHLHVKNMQDTEVPLDKSKFIFYWYIILNIKQLELYGGMNNKQEKQHNSILKTIKSAFSKRLT